MNHKTAIIIGAGPAGLTAAEQLLKHTDIKPLILEADSMVGGLSKTLHYKNNRMDIGGHRFFSKSDWVMQWWMEKLAPEFSLEGVRLHDPEKEDSVFMFRDRSSRIFHNNHFFDYPVRLSWSTIRNFGFIKSVSILLSYIYSRLFPLPSEENLENFFINRFGKNLYETFFKDYTEKVWGVKCTEISSSWGKSRIKNLSISKAILNALFLFFRTKRNMNQKEVETSLISKFIYPKFGPGQLWEQVASDIIAGGGEIHYNTCAVKLNQHENNVTEVLAKNNHTNELFTFHADYVISTMPMVDLVRAMNAPDVIQEIADGLVYRDFVVVGLLVDKVRVDGKAKKIKDNWIYIQESSVKLGRLQIFNNWSPYLVGDSDKYWLGLEYFCNENDAFWSMTDSEIIDFAISELHKIKMIDKADVEDSTMYRIPKAYPAYFGSYSRLKTIQDYTDAYANLFLIGRNGMHKYNNQDHSMLSAKVAVENIVNKLSSKSNIWSVNPESSYHESKAE
ncbi:MAG: NAD(P)/FAD-dependent oxidoreductase [Salinivirgaceae bacterium]|nr:NAD(P)/FAD-dependent oxidoreductase [Salinivirgaceae bacterium]